MAVSCSAYYCRAVAPLLLGSKQGEFCKGGAPQGPHSLSAKFPLHKESTKRSSQLRRNQRLSATARKDGESFSSGGVGHQTKGNRSFAVASARPSRAVVAPASDPGGSPASDGSESLQTLDSSSSMAFVGLAIGLSLVVGSILVEPANAATWQHQHASLDKDMQALAFNFDPLYDEFWDNVRRFILYFFSVTTGGIYMIVKPIGDLFKKPLTAALTVVILGGSFFLIVTVLQLMLGLTEA